MANSTRPERPWPVHRRFTVTYHDLDVLRHLNHAAYFPMMETLRCEYYLDVLGIRDPARLDIIIAEAACRYLAPVAYGDELEGEVAPVRPLGRTSFVLLYRFRDTTTLATTALGRTVIVTYNYARAAKREIPPGRRRRLEADAVDPVAAGWDAAPVRSTRKGGVGASDAPGAASR
jgi:acyl-CoA thioesterase FadM